jgi:hypothetical protein
LALVYGANDMGSLMIEENVVAEAGTVHHLSLPEIRGAISDLGYTPRQRNVHYQLFEAEHEARAIEANAARYERIRAAQRERSAPRTADGGCQTGRQTVPLSIVWGDNTA